MNTKSTKIENGILSDNELEQINGGMKIAKIKHNTNYFHTILNIIFRHKKKKVTN